MSNPRKTAIVTGASQGIGAGIVKGFLERGFNVVANSRKMTQSSEVAASDHVALVDGHIGEPATAARVVETALSRFKSIDALVNNAGIFFTKPFTDYTAEDFKSLVSTNLEGFLYVTQLSIKLTVLIATTERFTEHAQVADGASNLFARIFGPQSGHVRLVYGVYSLPIGGPVIVDVIFEIEPVRQSTSKPHQY